MNGLGRLLALPLLLITLAAQSLAPADAAAMRPDPNAGGICSAHALGGEAHRPERGKGRAHDCCAFACALAGLAAPPPGPTWFAPSRYEATADLRPAACGDAATLASVDRPRARAPPAPILTI